MNAWGTGAKTLSPLNENNSNMKTLKDGRGLSSYFHRILPTWLELPLLASSDAIVSNPNSSYRS